MSRPRFLADHDLNEHIVHGVLRGAPAIECIIDPVIDSLVLIWSASDAEEWQGQVVFLPR